MKTRIFFIIGLLLLYFADMSINKVIAQDKSTTDNSLRIVCTPDLYNLTNTLGTKFCKQNPEVKIEVVQFTDAELVNILTTEANLYLVSNETYSMLDKNELWKMKLGKDALVPIMNSKNPFLQEIKSHNISAEILAQIARNPDERIWYNFPKFQKNQLINYYSVNDQSEKSMIANFLAVKQNIQGISVENNENLIAAIQKDPYSIGFCKLSNLINSTNDKDITIMPIDISGNGEIDDFENVYTDLQTFLGNRWFGKFPKNLTETIYSIALQEPTNKAELDFLKYISTSGQQSLDQMGYVNLAYKEKQSNLKTLGYVKDILTTTESSSSSVSIYLISAIILLVIFVGFMLLHSSEIKAHTSKATNYRGVLDKSSLIIPTGIYFDKSHTWAFMEKDGLVGVGIDDFLQHIVGPITRIKMQETGSKVKKGDELLTIIQNGKQLTIKAPVSGVIKAQNKNLLGNSSLLNNSPYDQGWIYKIEPTNWLVETQFLVMWQKYNEWVKNEFTRLKDFLAEFVKPHMQENELVLQDGGEVKDGVLVDFGPEVWEDFQVNFIDTLK